MNKKHLFPTVMLLVTIFVSGCGPSTSQLATNTAILLTTTSTTVPTSTPSPTPTTPPTETATNTPTSTVAPGATMVSAMDGMTLVYVPAGDFSMGSLAGPVDEQPVHTVYLDAYWIDRTEVTNAMYSLCVQAGACLRPLNTHSNTRFSYYFNTDYVDFPVISLKWISAEKYCEWAGRHLPTEAEWEKAARGTDERTYPWGNALPAVSVLKFNTPNGDTVAVGSYSLGASPYGVLDMAGNVTEWVADWYAADYYGSSPSSNPVGPPNGDYRVLRGGSWISTEYLVRSADRHWLEPDSRKITVGFRCAMPAP